MPLGASRLKRVAFLPALLAAASLIFVSCGGSYRKAAAGSSGLSTRVLASQSVSSPTAFPGLIIIDGANDAPARAAEISAGASPGLMTVSPDRSTLLAFDSSSNRVTVVNTLTETSIGSIQLPGPTTSMVALGTGSGYAAVPGALVTGSPPGAVAVMNLTAGGVAALIGVPNAQTVVASPDGTQILVFSNDDVSDSVTILYPLLVNTGSPDTVTVPGFDRPVYGVVSADGSTAYILNCGPECASGTASASLQVLDMASLTLVGVPLPVDAATIGWLNGSTLYVAGTSPTNNLCTGQTTAAPTCGRLDIIDLGSMTVTGSVVITDGYHNRIDMSSNGQLFIGSHTCSNVGNVNNPQGGEVRGCLSIFNTTNATVVIPPDNGDATGLQGFTTRFVEYVAEGGNLRVYDTTKDVLLENSIITSGTISLPGQIIDVKAIDFF